jgi:23S rRNA (cytidine1920-2'-O)/16S rRNA (cytidine1409-2'-O)-methyltransferase
VLALIKPQFEVGPRYLKKGIVRDQEKQKDCVEKISDFCLKEGLKIMGVAPSPILGQKGNQEYFLAAKF